MFDCHSLTTQQSTENHDRRMEPESNSRRNWSSLIPRRSFELHKSEERVINSNAHPTSQAVRVQDRTACSAGCKSRLEGSNMKYGVKYVLVGRKKCEFARNLIPKLHCREAVALGQHNLQEYLNQISVDIPDSSRSVHDCEGIVLLMLVSISKLFHLVSDTALFQQPDCCVINLLDSMQTVNEHTSV